MPRVRGIAQLRLRALKQMEKQQAAEAAQVQGDVNPIDIHNRLRHYMERHPEPPPPRTPWEPVHPLVMQLQAHVAAQQANLEALTYLYPDQSNDGGGS